MGKKNPIDLGIDAKKGNKKAKKIFVEYGENLGVALSIIVNTLDPQIIIIGGGLSNSYPYFKDSMFRSLKKNCYNHSFDTLKVVRSKLKDASILGASCLVQCDIK